MFLKNLQFEHSKKYTMTFKIKKVERVNVYKKNQIFSCSREKFGLITARSSSTTLCVFCMKKRMKKQRLKVLLLETQVLGTKKFKISCERGWTKIRDRSSRWKQWEVQVLQRNAFQVRIKVYKYKSLKGLLKEVQVLCPGKIKTSCERGSPCIFHVQKHKKIVARSSVIIWEQFDFKKKIKNSNYKD